IDGGNILISRSEKAGCETAIILGTGIAGVAGGTGHQEQQAEQQPGGLGRTPHLIVPSLHAETTIPERIKLFEHLSLSSASESSRILTAPAARRGSFGSRLLGLLLASPPGCLRQRLCLFLFRFDDAEDEAAGQRLSFQQLDRDRLAKSEDASRAPPDQTVLALVVDVVILGQGADRRQTIGAGRFQGDKETKTGDAADSARKDLADMLLQEGGSDAVDSIPLRSRGPPFGEGDGHADLLEAFRIHSGQAIAP